MGGEWGREELFEVHKDIQWKASLQEWELRVSLWE